MRLLTNEDAPAFVSSIEKLLHPRSREVVAHIGLGIYELYQGYADYKTMVSWLPTEPYQVVVTREELAVYIYIFGCATIVYSELSVRERIIVPVPVFTVVPLLVNGEPDSIEGTCVATIHRNGIAAEYFGACAENTYHVYRAYAEA